MFRYDKAWSSIEYLEQNIKYKTQNLHGNLKTTQLICNQGLAISSGLSFNGIFPIVGLVWISQMFLNNIFSN